MNVPEKICTAIDNSIFCSTILRDSNNSTIYIDMCGHFPVQPYSDMQYIFVVYIYCLFGVN